MLRDGGQFGPKYALSHNVRIDALLESGDRWSKRLEVMPARDYAGPLNVKFPIDINLYREVIDAIVQETGASGGTCTVELVADVHTVAVTELGTIDEVFSHALKGDLGGATLSFQPELSSTESGTIGGGTVGGSSDERRFPLIDVVVGVLGLLTLGFLLWSWRQLGVAGLSSSDRAAHAAAKKYRDSIVEVSQLPEMSNAATVVIMDTLDALARVAEDCTKPMLHDVIGDDHHYVVLDGVVRYEYVVTRGDASADDEQQ